MQTCLLRGRGLCLTEQFCLRKVLHRRQQGYHARRAMCAAQQQQPFDGSSTRGFVWTRKMDKACPPQQRFKFCNMCGGSIAMAVPPGENELRHVCQQCSAVSYLNPKMVVGCIVEHEGKILLAKRAIEPCRGKWTVPAGYLELNESSAEGAARETWEEAHAHVQIQAPYTFFDIPLIGQIYVLFRARLASPYTFDSDTEESTDVRLFAPADIPWEEIAFSSIEKSLRLFVEDLASGRPFRLHHGVIDKIPGSHPSQRDVMLKDHFSLQTTVPSKL